MKKSIPILSALAAAAITVTACSTPPTVYDSGPPPSKTIGSEPKVMPAEVANAAIAAAQRFGAEQLDTVGAHGALTAGRPFLVGLPDGAVPACHIALLVPGDPAVWILNTSGAASSAGSTLSREQLQYGCDSGVELPTSYALPVPAPNPPLNEAAKAKAAAAKVPFLYGLPSGPERACHTTVVLPDGAHWFLTRPGAASVKGTALDRTVKDYGCTGRGETYGSEHDGTPLPGQTAAPATGGAR